MNPKMKSAIEKITLNDATFSNEVIECKFLLWEEWCRQIYHCTNV